MITRFYVFNKQKKNKQFFYCKHVLKFRHKSSSKDKPRFFEGENDVVFFCIPVSNILTKIVKSCNNCFIYFVLLNTNKAEILLR